MKKTYNINIAGYPFVINDDAYTLLHDYLDTISSAFRNVDDSSEIITDIENRVAELLLESSDSGRTIITATQVEEVIARIGKPEEMLEEETVTGASFDRAGHETVFEAHTERETTTPPPFTGNTPKLPKRLFRDPQNAMLGGVCSGIACYLNIDVTWVRLITVILTIASVSTCGIAYLILWIVLPEANTPLQRMQMLGETPTVENIGKTVTENYREEQGIASPTPVTSRKNFIIEIITKVVIIGLLIIGVPLLISIITGLIGCIFSLIMFSTTGLSTLFGMELPGLPETGIIIKGLLCGIGVLLFLGIPLFLLIRKGMGKKAGSLSKSWKWVLSILCIGGFILAAVCAGLLVRDTYTNENISKSLNMTIDNIESSEQILDNKLVEIEKAQDRYEVALDKVEIARDRLEMAIDQAGETNSKKAWKKVEKARKYLEKTERDAERARKHLLTLMPESNNNTPATKSPAEIPADSVKASPAIENPIDSVASLNNI